MDSGSPQGAQARQGAQNKYVRRWGMYLDHRVEVLKDITDTNLVQMSYG